MEKLVILGGTFDPPHLGHMRLLAAARDAFRADLAWFVPDRVPPHKSAAHMTEAAHRLEMCRLCAMEMGAEVSELELKREGKSYTVDTLEGLNRLGKYDIGLTMGGDMLQTLPQWYRYRRILELAHIVAVIRQEADTDFWEAAKAVEADGGKITAFVLPPDGISSTLVRSRVASGESITDLVPGSVARYIAAHNLYQE